jgi:two-component system, NarL family, response regulator NreC
MPRVRVVIADDHPLVRAGIGQLLASHSQIEVVGTAENGIEAVEAAGDLLPDVILLDIAMPDISGLQAIPRIRDASPTTRILVISMYDDPEYAQEAVRLGACGLVSKAGSSEELIAAIMAAHRGEEVLQKEIPLSPREREVLSLVGRGRTNAEIASLLAIRVKTVEHHRQRLMNKLDIHTEAGLVAHARRSNMNPC